VAQKKMPKDAQAAAVRSMLGSKSLDDIKAEYPDLADGVSIVENELAKPAARGSGPSGPSKFARTQL
jgi:hypothetical protein